MPTRRLFLSILFLQVFLFVFITPFSFSQEYSYHHFTVKDGLVQNQLTTMFQDRQGYIWLGTKGGVSRFDGFKFQNYTVNDGLVSNHIVRIFEDCEGGIYFCSIIGTSRYLDGNFATVIWNDTLTPISGINKISRINENEFCGLNSSDVPLYTATIDAEQAQLLSTMSNIEISNLIRDDISGRYYIQGIDGTLYCMANDTVLTFANNLKGHFIKDESGRVYAFEGNSIYTIDPIMNNLDLLYKISGNEIAIMYDFDKNGNAYFGSGQKKVIVFDGSGILEYNKKFNYINDILVDREDNLWIATETGFYKKINNAFENFTPETGANEYVWSFVEDDRKQIWFASYGDGLCVWNGQAFSKITAYQNVYNFFQGNYFYTGAISATNHNLYFPVKDKGILQFDGSNFSLLPGLPHGSVLDVYEDRLNNRLLAASTAGLIILENYTGPVWYKRNFHEVKKHIKTIAQDKFGRYWLGGEYMLQIFDGKDFIEFPNDKYNYAAGAISIFMDHHKNLWLGTTSGLYFYNYNEFIKVAKNELKSQVVSFVELDTTKLVMGVSEGLAILDLGDFYENSIENLKILDDASGFFGFDCIRSGILKDSDNNIWIAASERVVKFYPDKLKPDTIHPVVRLQQITAKGAQPEDVKIFSVFKNPDSTFELPYYFRNFRMEFHAVHFTAPEKIKYSYMLTGNDETWSLPSNERFASYTNLLPGKYTFNVRAQNMDGLWSDYPAIVSFEIIPAFWQTLTFRMIINILILLISLSIIYFVRNFRKKRKAKIDKTEKQISELQLKTIRSQMDPHFTFNALNSISSIIYKGDKEKAYRYFTKFSKLVRSSLEVSDKITRTLEEEIDFTKNYLDLEKIRFKDQFEYSFHIHENVAMGTMVPKMILQSYSENAVKHGLKHKENNRRLKIEVFSYDNLLIISIEDNGVGRKKAKTLKEFSTGKGLKIMNNIYDLYLKLYKVRIEQEIEDLTDDSGNATGTRVVLKIPALKQRETL